MNFLKLLMKSPPQKTEEIIQLKQRIVALEDRIAQMDRREFRLTSFIQEMRKHNFNKKNEWELEFLRKLYIAREHKKGF